MHRPSPRLLWIAAQLSVGAIGLAVFALNGDVWTGLAVMALMAASVVAFEIAHRRRMPIASLLTGIGDERARSLYREGNAATGELMAYVIAVWGFVVVAQGKDGSTFVAVAAAYAALWLLGIARAALSDRSVTPRRAP